MATLSDSSTSPNPRANDASLGTKVADKAQAAVDRTARNPYATADRVAENATPAIETFRSSVDSASAALHRGAEKFDEYQERWLANCRGHVRDYPLLSLGIAVAAGMVINRWLSR